MSNKNNKEHKKHAIIENIIGDDDSVIESIDRKIEKELDETKRVNNLYVNDPEFHGRSKLEMRAREIFMALAAVIIGSVGTVSIMIPNGLTFGGITGIARIIQQAAGVRYSFVYFGLAAVIAVCVWAILGFKEFRKIVFMSVMYPVVMFVLEDLDFVMLKSDDLFLVSVVVGVLSGISNGLTFRAGFSSGGADSIAKIIKYKFVPHVGINDITFVINALIIMGSVFEFGMAIAMYAIVITYISMRVGETVMYGFSNKVVELNIITTHPDELVNYLMYELGRGASSLEVTGEYTGEVKKQIKLLCSPRESFIVKRYLAKHDPKSFVTVTSIKSVWGAGKGFSDIHEIDS